MAKALIGSAGKRLAIAALLLLAAACASAPADPTRIDYSSAPPADWPRLLISVHDVAPDVLSLNCPKAVAPGLQRRGCAAIRFCTARCSIFISEKVPAHKRAEVLEHERAHCQGYDHHGSTSNREAWERAKARGC